MSIHERINTRAHLVAMVKDRRHIALIRKGVAVATFMPMVTGYSVSVGVNCAFLAFTEVVNEAMYIMSHNENIDFREGV